MPRPAPKQVKQSTPAQPETVSAQWLAKALGAVILLALVCSYLTLCLLYYQGQWQIVLHPQRESGPAPAGLLRFAPDESGQPRLTGEWLAAGEGGRYGGATVLLLPDGNGSRQNAAVQAHALNNLGLNVLWFDYRGFGWSAAVHPSEMRMEADAQSAWRYLTETRGIAAQKIVPYGIGVGAPLAVRLAEWHSEIPAVILDAPRGDLLDVARKDSRSNLIPAKLLFHERFALTDPISALAAPKLLLTPAGHPEPAIFTTAKTPKMIVTPPFASGNYDPTAYNEALRRFFDQYVSPSGAPLMPSAIPSGTKPH
jgi:pimeloyl-ACP methyl ester carboxylesterase